MNQKRKQITPEEIAAFLKNCGPETRVYLGADSERHRYQGVWYADYTIACVIHIDGCKGCKLFGEVHTERDLDQRQDRPFNRMMTEAMKVAELYLRLKEVLYDYEVEVHLDIATDQVNGSSCAAAAATGYIKAMCNVTPILKDHTGGTSFAASFAADRVREVQNIG